MLAKVGSSLNASAEKMPFAPLAVQRDNDVALRSSLRSASKGPRTNIHMTFDLKSGRDYPAELKHINKRRKRN